VHMADILQINFHLSNALLKYPFFNKLIVLHELVKMSRGRQAAQ
jgi:hypothetical protein